MVKQQNVPGTLQRVALIENLSLQGRDFCDAYTHEVDSWLSRVFDAAVASGKATSATGATGDEAGPALVALGGHGRGELCPQSDLDLLLLVPERYDVDALAERIWYPIWDAGLKVGHSVRTLRDTLSLASEDLNTATALLSARHLSGNPALSAALAERAKAGWRRNGRKWIGILAKSVRDRHTREDEVAFTLEPDLKEGRGGLRDVHAIQWAQFAGADVTDSAIEALRGDYDTILAARVELHRATERFGDRLLLQEQSEVARRLGDGDTDDLMSRIAGAARSIAWRSDETWFDVDVAISARSTWGPTRRGRDRLRLADHELAEGIQLRDRRVRLIDEANPIADGHTVLRVALQAAQNDTRISAPTLDLMAVAPALSEPWDESARRLFCSLLMTGVPAIEVIETLDHAGVWTHLIHEWEQVRGRFQRNALHRFTVDRHLLETAARASDLAGRTHRPDLLVVGALLHDIGKGYRGDHSSTGELIAAGIARRMGFTPGESATIGFLARWHLLLSDTARRRDLEDPATLRFVAGKVGSTERLALLHALTEADGIATGPGVWTSWTSTLVDRLVASVAKILEEKSGSTDDQSDTTASGEVAAAVPSAASVDRGAMPMVAGQGEWVVVVCEDRPGVMCRVAGALALHGLNVIEATAESDGDVAVDRFRVEPSVASLSLGSAGRVDWDRVSEDIDLALTGRLAIRARLSERESSHRRRYEPGLSVLEAGVRFDDEMTAGATVVEVVGLDRAGLLYELARALGELDVDIRSAKIHTMGVDAIDTFYISDRDGNPITDADFRREIQRSLQFVMHNGE